MIDVRDCRTYGLQRLALLGSAEYSRALLPLNGAISLTGPNNAGKTTIINALQFMLVVDRRRMKFGDRKIDESRRFYFPDNSAYLLLEVSTESTGHFVLGCVGKGVSHDYIYFAYKGQLDMNEYRTDDDSIVKQPDLQNHMVRHNRSVRFYESNEFMAMLYGNPTGTDDNQPDISIFKLEYNSYQKSFQHILARIFHLNKLTAEDVKSDLMMIYERALTDSKIDFEREWEQAFADVNADRKQYDMAIDNKELIDQLEKDYNHCMQLRGKVLAWQPSVNDSLDDWQTYYESILQNLCEQKRLKQECEKGVLGAALSKNTAKDNAERRISDLKAIESRQSELSKQFALLTGRAQLEDNQAQKKEALERQIIQIGMAEERDPESLKKDKLNMQNELDGLERALRNQADNLYLALHNALPEEQRAGLSRILSMDAMTLPPSDFNLDPQSLQQALQGSDDTQVRLPGLQLSLASLPAPSGQLTKQELEEQIDDTKTRIQQMDELLCTHQNIMGAKSRKAHLEKELDGIKQSIKDYDEWQELKQNETARMEKLNADNADLKQLVKDIENINGQFNVIRDQLGEIDTRKRALKQKHKTVEAFRQHRNDYSKYFLGIESRPAMIWNEATAWELLQLPDVLETYQEDCVELVKLEDKLQIDTERLQQKGLTKYENAETVDRKIQQIVDYSHNLPSEFEALVKAEGAAVMNVTQCLKSLRSGAADL